MGNIDRADCPHGVDDLVVELVVVRCRSCGERYIDRRAVEEIDEGERALLHLRQGKLDRTCVREVTRRVSPPAEGLATVLPACDHPAERRKVERCPINGQERERCMSCGRTFGSPHQWVLEHQYDKEATNFGEGS